MKPSHRPWEKRLDRLARRICARFGPPVMVIGMHRSGTSLVARQLRAAGGYLGSRLDPNSESLLFLQLNHSILTAAGVTWDAVPDGFRGDELVDHPAVWRCLLRNQHLLWSEFFKGFGKEGKETYSLLPEEYLLPEREGGRLGGFPFWARRRRPAPFWGWKDPRSTLTLQAWLRMFPQARVIHVLRSGIDAALSLWKRSCATGEGAPSCTDPVYCFEMWERYVTVGVRGRSLPPAQYLELRYEDLLRDPEPHVRRLQTFLAREEADTEAMIRLVDPGRASARPREAPASLLRRAAESSWMESLGYHDGR